METFRHDGLVPDNTVHKGDSCPPSGTWGSLTFDIDISSYTVIDFSFLFSLFYTTCITEGEYKAGGNIPITLQWLPVDTAGLYTNQNLLAMVSTFSVFSFGYRKSVVV